MYLAYVPAVRGTEDLVLCDADAVFLEGRMRSLRAGYPDMILLLSFPDDESVFSGCLAAGRGFFHISSSGNAEPCPFSPYSQQSLKSSSVLDVLQPPFFREVRDISMRGRSFPYRKVYAVFS